MGFIGLIFNVLPTCMWDRLISDTSETSGEGVTHMYVGQTALGLLILKG